MVKTTKIMNLIFFLIMICINILANILPIGHGNTGMISERYPNLFTPAPVTFGIWGVIYLLLAIFIVYQLGIYGDVNLSESLVRLIGGWFIFSCLMNVGWIFSWHYEIIWLSLVFMVLLLFSLIVITMNINREAVTHVAGTGRLSFSVMVTIYGFDIYLGWIVAATIANISVLLVDIDWNRFGFSEVFWMTVALIVSALVGMCFVLAGDRYFAAATIIWAYIGILIKHISPKWYGGSYSTVITTTIICIIAVLSAALVSAIVRSMNN